MRTPSAGSLLRVRITHLCVDDRPGRGGDAVGIPEGQDGDEHRLFVPGVIACGECDVCRRGFPAACPRRTPLLPGEFSGRSVTVEVPDRYLTPLTAGLELPELSSTAAASAGIVAEVIDAAARVGTGPGDTAVWFGGTAVAHAGARWSTRRGCRTFHLAARPALADGVVALAPDAGPEGWLATMAATDGAAGGERRLFVCGAAPALTTAALALSRPGSTVVFLAGPPADLVDLDGRSALRIHVAAGYHPDFVPEALAAFRRGDVDPDAISRSVAPDELASALGDLRAGTDTRVPVMPLWASA